MTTGGSIVFTDVTGDYPMITNRDLTTERDHQRVVIVPRGSDVAAFVGAILRAALVDAAVEMEV